MGLEQLKSLIKQLSNSEIVELRDWLDDLAEKAEDQLEVSGEFKAKILEAEREIREDRASGVRRPID